MYSFKTYIAALCASLLAPAVVTSLKFNTTSISARNGSSTLECWEFDGPVSVSSDPSYYDVVNAGLGPISNLTYTYVPPQHEPILHTAPFKQWVFIVTGLTYFTLPDDPSTTALITGGEFGLVFASDTPDVSVRGHASSFPGLTDTICLQMPVAGDKIPDHRFLHMGQCNAEEMTGLRGMSAVASAARKTR
ncbi:uncharacterized protein GGS25DRAFT_284208 [Hypoxylon fragiforme]|uniref:uncharacterized protein n=1 Tax=Hypoxylon fragiforme TaxID=63214 RepID=UPI0020C6B7F2|nr:uncharacterized protein GGS25DRAFT_284208 [Hypoxylon fragiforme]KAI2608592.1 hypothetical protein GGS25DRAFT_284208 [Hypoxylon fragiforme]